MRAGLALTALLLVHPLFAQHEHHEHAADLGNLGTVHFATSCNVAAQANFTRGVALIHSFWYSEAEKSFRKAAADDPTCGIAWWGVAMSNYHPVWAAPTPDELKTGADAAAKAKEVGAKTDGERDYIGAINAFYSGTGDHASRAAAYESAMEKVATAYPKDDEASIFYALSLLGTASPNDKTYTKQKKAAEILGIERRTLYNKAKRLGIDFSKT